MTEIEQLNWSPKCLECNAPADGVLASRYYLEAYCRSCVKAAPSLIGNRDEKTVWKKLPLEIKAQRKKGS